MVLIHLIQYLARARRVEKTLGVVGDFCPFCHTARPFALKRAAWKEVIGTGQGKTLEYVIVCSTCGALLGADPMAYEKLEPKGARPHNLRALIEDTHPQFWRTYAKRLAFEEELRRSPGTIPPETRAGYMMELFRLLNPMVTTCYKNHLRFDWRSGVSCLATLTISFWLYCDPPAFVKRLPVSAFTGHESLTVLVAGSLITLALLVLAPGRYFRSRLLPRLARGLAPLQPMREELDALLVKCKAMGMKIGRKTKPEELVAAIAKAPALAANDQAINILRPPANLQQAEAAHAGAAGDRARQIAKIFYSINPTVEKFYTGGMNFDKQSGMGCLGTIVLGGGLAAVALTVFENTPWQDRLCLVAGVVAFIGACYTVVQLVGVPGRSVQKTALVRLAATLRPLNPSEAEIIRALEKCKTADMMIGTKIKPAQVLSALRGTPAKGNI